MSISNRDIGFYVDCMIVEAIASDPKLYKTAEGGGLVMSLIDKVKGYVGNNIDPNDKAGSLINILGPGVIFTAFKAFGFGWLGLLISLAMRIFHIDVSGIVTSIWDKLKGMISGDKQVSSTQVDAMVQSAVQDHVKPATQEEADQAEQVLKKSYDQMMRDARMVKLTMIEYSTGKMKKEAGFLDLFNTRKMKTTNILTKVLGWIFKVSLASAGLMVAGDVVNKFLGRPNALDGSVQKGKPVQQDSSSSAPPAAVMPVTSQTKFKANTAYKVEHNNTGVSWTEPVSNNEGAIGTMLVGFAKDVYSGLDGKESIIQGTAGFQAIADRITFFNRNATGSQVVFIPPEFHSKKQMVDYFIDDVAEKAT
jgi:hypothetical protein